MSVLRRKIVKLLLLLLVLSGILPFVYPWQRPLLSLDDISLPKLQEIEKKLPELPRLDSRDRETVTVYRWRGKNGNWSFGSEPPQGVKYEPITVNPDANLIQGLPQEEAKEEEKTISVESGENNDSPQSTGYSAEDLSKIMQSAKEARAAMEQHYKREEAIINEAR